MNPLQRLLQPLMNRVNRLFLLGIIQRVNNDQKLQRLLVKTIGGAVFDNIEVFGQYGLATKPLPGQDVVLLEKNGRYICVAIGDRKYRLKKLNDGDVALYDDKGQTVILSDAGIELTDKFHNHVNLHTGGITLADKNGNNVKMKSGQIDLNGVIIDAKGNITCPGTVTAAQDVVAAKTSFISHNHEFNYNAGATPAMGQTMPPTK